METKLYNETYRDIMETKLCQEISVQFEKSGFHWLSCIFNTNGVALYKSSKIDVWLICKAINEIPVQERFFCENILFRVWQGRSKPPIHTFMKTFFDGMKKLACLQNSLGSQGCIWSFCWWYWLFETAIGSFQTWFD